MYEAMVTTTWIAAATESLRVGSLVLCDSFRHPAVLAQEAVTIDHASGGRFDLGIGPGSGDSDATALGQPPWSSTERMDRFEEFLGILRAVLDGDAVTRTTMTGRYYAATDTPSTPGALQAPLPMTVAAGGRREGAGEGARRSAEGGVAGVAGGVPGGGGRASPAVAQARAGQEGGLGRVRDAPGEGVLGLGLALLVTSGEGGELQGAGDAWGSVAP